MDVSIGIVGSGPATEAVAAALDDVDVPTRRGSIEALSAHRLAVVVGRAGNDVFTAVDGSRDDPWVGIELGGIGGHAIEGVEASVAGFAPETGCYDCLRTRIAAGEIELEEGDPGPAIARLAGAIAGHRIVAALRGEGDEVFGRVIELPYAERRLLRVPTCDRCGGRPSPPPDGGESRSVEEAIAHAEAGVDERVGIVRSVGEVASFPVPYYLATTAETDGFSDASAANQAAGVAADWNTAYVKALGEALERYSAGVYRDRWFEYARTDEIEDAVVPERFVGVDTTDAEIPWVAGERLDTGESVSLPAEFVHFPPPEKRFGPAITTGLGLGNTRTEALLSGLYEVIERDATMLAWYSTFEPLELVVEDGTFRTLERRAASEGLSVTPLLVTQDVDVPVVAVAVHREAGEDEWPRFALGSDADLDAESAARSALCEALQNWMELRSMGPEAAAEESGWIGRYGSLPNPAREFLDVSGRVEADAVGERSLGPDDELASLVRRVTGVELTPYAAWITPRDVRTLGFEATRVVVPEAQPLFTRQPTFGERAETVPRSMGFEPRLERDPHPYP
ncbi:YcaO-like family protein [Halalkalicoccus sp. NIPERK01]|uniref:YcaO-like family protein n=1 Tax=Halalkalicoccus sp. NIPERK01 TaxID=3053469 RepID=UPI00256EABE6|nr:YcaO-like family protein [Halalkalicoccus sp. NIPERK01]MDL5361265.1 YcaO-like family protein [Halalkalicoccus sp. NIPERK01]